MIKPKRNAHNEVYPAILAVVVDCAGQVHFLMTVLIVCWVLKRGGHDAFANSQQDHIPQSNREASLNANGLAHLFPPLSTLLPAYIRIRVNLSWHLSLRTSLPTGVAFVAQKLIPLITLLPVVVNTVLYRTI